MGAGEPRGGDGGEGCVDEKRYDVLLEREGGW